MNRKLNFLFWISVVLVAFSCIWLLVEWIGHTGRVAVAWDVLGTVASIGAVIAYLRKRQRISN